VRPPSAITALKETGIGLKCARLVRARGRFATAASVTPPDACSAPLSQRCSGVAVLGKNTPTFTLDEIIASLCDQIRSGGFPEAWWSGWLECARSNSIASAGRDTSAHNILCRIGAELLASDTPLPAPLCDYLVEVLSHGGRPPPTKRGPKPETNIDRDRNVVRMIQWVITHHGLAATRNRAARENEGAPESACSFVAKIYSDLLSEDAVEKIWRQRSMTASVGPNGNTVWTSRRKN
jgi:hypothetical protein